MVKITLYNISGYKKKQVFYCFVGFFCIHSICIPNIQKVKRRYVFGRKNTSASMLRIYKNKNRITLRALGLYVYHLSIYLLRRVNYIFKKLNICTSKNIYIMYIYINSTLVSVNHIAFKKKC